MMGDFNNFFRKMEICGIMVLQFKGQLFFEAGRYQSVPLGTSPHEQ